MLSQSSDANVADWGPELNERMSLVVLIGRTGFAVGAEVGIVAHSALVAIADNVPSETTL